MASATPNGISSSHEEQPPAYSSPTPDFGSPAPDSSRGGSTAESAKTAVFNAAEATGVATAASAVSHAVPRSGDDLKEQLAAAKAEIQRLTKQMQDSGFRQRKVQEASEKVQTAVQQSSESGVSLQIVAILCLISFLIGYLFF